MNIRSIILSRLGIITGVLLLGVSPLAAGQSDAQKPEQSLVVAGTGKKSSKTNIIYRPPPCGAPSGRVGGGTRGAPTRNRPS